MPKNGLIDDFPINNRASNIKAHKSLMKKQYGRIIGNDGTYILNKIPEAGNFEYIYKNKRILLKVDQFGPSLIQLNPPSGMYILQRKEREIFSPLRYYFYSGKKLVHNFDIYSAKKFEITYRPNYVEYLLKFQNIDVLTKITIDGDNQNILFNLEFKNDKDIDVLSVCSLDPIDFSMAVWDKKEWYSSTTLENTEYPCFLTRHYSVNGEQKERQNIFFYTNKKSSSNQNSAERVRYFTKNFSLIPSSIASSDIEEVACYEQICSSIFHLEKNGSLFSIINAADFNEKFNEKDISNKLNSSYLDKILTESNAFYKKLFLRRTVNTPDDDFNNFVNSFLPLEINWVSDLDRGWPTGMRGTRDCSNDFMGLLAYDLPKCRALIKTLFENQRFGDGWFPRQIPSSNSNKYDMRPFSDSNAFVIELVYEYLCYSNDFSLLDENISFLQSDISESGLSHLIKAADYYCLESNIGEHGLYKLNGGDWLDCLNRVGLKGRAETVMVTCQAILAFKQVKEVLLKFGDKYSNLISKYDKQSETFKKNVKKYSYINKEDFYRGIFSDDGRWYFSENDLDGHKRVYVPTNSYAILANINPSKNKRVIRAINRNNESKYGFKLFTHPFGNPPFEGIGKMGTGDFKAYMFENGSVYNHGANLFYARALANVGDYKTFYRALNYSLPYNSRFHPESQTCLPSFAVTNSYNLLDTFTGRGGMVFLTGSIAMIERAIYNWMFGLDYHIEYLRVKPCLPKQYANSTVEDIYLNNKITFSFKGYGSNVESYSIRNKTFSSSDGSALINKDMLKDGTLVEVFLKDK